MIPCFGTYFDIYDSIGIRLVTIDYPDPDADVSFVYDPAGNRISMTDAKSVVTRYEYDALSWLTAAVENYRPGFLGDHETNVRTEYTYDPVGNRLTQETHSGTNLYAYDATNQLIEVDGVVYAWDAIGNLLDDGKRTYAYDHTNRLIALSDQGSVYGYTYNGFGDRLQQSVDGNVSNYSLDLNTGLTQVLIDDSNVYLYGLGRIGEDQTDIWAYHMNDALASLRQLTDANDTINIAKDYEPYGRVLRSTGTISSSFSFTEEWTDVSGLIHMRARYYDPEDGRFISKDSWQGDPSKPLSMNHWNFAGSNPIMLGDPTGRCYGPLQFLRKVPIESSICETLDQAMFIYAWPGSTSGQRTLASAYIGGWAFAHSALIVGAGGLVVAGGKAAVVWLYGLYLSSPAAEQISRACRYIRDFPLWRNPNNQLSMQRTIYWLENQIFRVQHIMDSRHAWDRLVTLSGNLLQDYRAIQPYLTQVMNTPGRQIDTSTIGPVLEFTGIINGQEIIVRAIQIADNVLQITDAWIRIR